MTKYWQLMKLRKLIKEYITLSEQKTALLKKMEEQITREMNLIA